MEIEYVCGQDGNPHLLTIFLGSVGLLAQEEWNGLCALASPDSFPSILPRMVPDIAVPFQDLAVPYLWTTLPLVLCKVPLVPPSVLPPKPFSSTMPCSIFIFHSL